MTSNVCRWPKAYPSATGLYRRGQSSEPVRWRYEKVGIRHTVRSSLLIKRPASLLNQGHYVEGNDVEMTPRTVTALPRQA